MRHYGWKHSHPDTRDYRVALPTPTAIAVLPPAVDLRTLDPMVLDQGQLGSCVANAVGMMHHFLQIKERHARPFVPSRLMLYYDSRVIENTVGFDAGTSPADTLWTLHVKGACPETEWPYAISQFAVQPPALAYTQGLDAVALKYASLNVNPNQDQITPLKAALARGYPFVFGFDVYGQFETVGGDGNVDLPGPSNSQYMGGHCMLVVGYDDRHRQGDFLVKNSWNTDWGMGGFCWFPYAYMLQCYDQWMLYYEGAVTTRDCIVDLNVAIDDLVHAL